MKKTDVKYLIEARKVWKNVIHSSAFSSEQEVLQQHIDFYKTFFNIFQAGNYYYLLFDVFHGELIDVGTEVKKVLGYSSELVNVDLIINNMHPDDKTYFLSFEEQVTAFFNNIDVNEYPYYKVQYDIRLKTLTGDYRRILFQYLVVNYDDKNIYHTFHIHTDISHSKQLGRPCFSILGLEGRPSYHNIQNNQFITSSSLFTRREREVLKEIVEGKSSKQIAETLHLSLHTINAHKRNIMEKAEAKTVVELVVKTVKESWI